MSDIEKPSEVSLERIIPARDIESRFGAEVAASRSPLGLMGDVLVGSYGAIGFALLDAAPENRITDWNGASDYCGYESEDSEPRLDPDNPWYSGQSPLDAEVAARRYGTRHGFKVIRYTILPQQLLDRLSGNKWVGPAVIQQALEQDVLPPEFEEEEIGPYHAFLTHTGIAMHGENSDMAYDRAKRIIERKMTFLKHFLPMLDGSIAPDIFDRVGPLTHSGPWLPGDRHRAFISFHPWSLMGTVRPIVENGVQTMINNLDELFRMIADKDGSIRTDMQTNLSQDATYLPIARLAVEASSEQPTKTANE